MGGGSINLVSNQEEEILSYTMMGFGVPRDQEGNCSRRILLVPPAASDREEAWLRGCQTPYLVPHKPTPEDISAQTLINPALSMCLLRFLKPSYKSVQSFIKFLLMSTGWGALKVDPGVALIEFPPCILSRDFLEVEKVRGNDKYCHRTLSCPC